MIDVNTHEFRVDRVDNGNGTHTIMVDHVQVGPPIPWDDTLTEHMVRQTCLRIQREMRPIETPVMSPEIHVSPPFGQPVGPASPGNGNWWIPGQTYIYYGDPLLPPHGGFTVTS